MNLHIPTMVFLAGLICALVSASMFRIASRYPAHLLLAIRLWGLSCLFASAGAFLIFLRPVAPGFLSVVVGNWAIVAAFTWAYFAVCGLSNVAPGFRKPLLAWLATCLFVYAFVFLRADDLVTRVVTVSLMKLPVLVLLVAALFAHHRANECLASGAMGLVYLAYGIVSLARAVYTASVAPTNLPDVLNDPFQQISLTLFFMTLTATSIFFMLALGGALNRELRRRASIDVLTGVYNRQTFEELARRELARGQRTGRAPGMLMVDVDHFKRINDSLGHLAGDGVLAAVANALSGSLRQHDLIGRWGGEEFCILLPDTTSDEVGAVAERLRVSVMAAVRTADVTGDAPVTVSIGVVSPGRVIEDFGAMLQAADDALYRAKSDGRNRVVASRAQA